MRLTAKDRVRDQALFLRPNGDKNEAWVATFIKQSEVHAVLDKLAAYEDAEEEGLLVRLPCKTGDTVYYLTGNPTLASGYHFNRVESTKCIGFYLDREGLQICLYMPHGNHGTYGRYGKTIFLAREEAEAALQEKKYE